MSGNSEFKVISQNKRTSYRGSLRFQNYPGFQDCDCCVSAPEFSRMSLLTILNPLVTDQLISINNQHVWLGPFVRLQE